MATHSRRTPVGTALRALALGLALSATAPVLADSIPDVQRLIKQKQYDQALEKVDSYLVTKPGDAQGRFLKGLILTETNKPTEAITIFTKLTEDYPELPEPYNNLAVLYAQQKQYDRARSALEMAIRAHPSYAMAYENLGDIYAKLASQSYDKALQLDSANPSAQAKVAQIRALINPKASQPQPVAKPAAPVVAPDALVPATAPAQPVAASKAPNTAVVTTTPGAAAPKAIAAQSSETKSGPADAHSSADITKAVNDWAKAWSDKNLPAYLAFYAPDFPIPKGQTRTTWEAEREARLNKPGISAIAAETPLVTLDGNKATAQFRLTYSYGNFKRTITKVLMMVNRGSEWQIQQEYPN